MMNNPCFHDPALLLEAEQLWLTGEYDRISSVVVNNPEVLPPDFPDSFIFSESDIRYLYMFTDTCGRLKLHESFINYLQRFVSRIEKTGSGENGTDRIILRGPLIQLKLAMMIYPELSATIE